MDEAAETALQLVTAQLVAVAGVIHLWDSVPRLVTYWEAGATPDPLAPLSALFVLGLVAGLLAFVLGARRDLVYLYGALLMVGPLVGYVAWHFVGDLGGLLPGAFGHTHGGPFLAGLSEHMVADPVDFVSKVAELGALVCLSALFVIERGKRG
ncbi:hypothetical protein [Natronorarus salvus]|uniref:hypothetical protein n=1 Tax=Natronorarus salvus TaxID=3117733 RepID=UPI002F269C37